MLSLLVLVSALSASPPIPLPDAVASVARVQAGGVQVYRCTRAGGGVPAWTLDHPAATLYRDDGVVFGTHGGGPAWTAVDGSSITGDAANPLSRVDAPQGTGVPWLALRVRTHDGNGILTAVRYVERYDTLGGLAPDAAGCNAGTIGTAHAVHYSAVYEFYR